MGSSPTQLPFTDPRVRLQLRRQGGPVLHNPVRKWLRVNAPQLRATLRASPRGGQSMILTSALHRTASRNWLRIQLQRIIPINEQRAPLNKQAPKEKATTDAETATAIVGHQTPPCRSARNQNTKFENSRAFCHCKYIMHGVVPNAAPIYGPESPTPVKEAGRRDLVLHQLDFIISLYMNTRPSIAIFWQR